jgi:hypothetical protein
MFLKEIKEVVLMFVVFGFEDIIIIFICFLLRSMGIYGCFFRDFLTILKK